MTDNRQVNQDITRLNNYNLIQAITDGLKTMLADDKNILLLGEDIGVNGGVFRATEGLQKEFGEKRVKIGRASCRERV